MNSDVGLFTDKISEAAWRMRDKIELISVDILRQYPQLYRELEDMNHALALSSGWHYALDWLWIIGSMGEIAGKRVLDAGAGIGLLQWYLASKGADVVSVDRSDRACIPFHILNRFKSQVSCRKITR